MRNTKKKFFENYKKKFFENHKKKFFENYKNNKLKQIFFLYFCFSYLINSSLNHVINNKFEFL